MVDKIKVEDKNLLIIELFPKLKIVYLLPFLLNLPFLKFWKVNFINFGDKHVETENQSNLLISKVSHALKKMFTTSVLFTRTRFNF